MELISTLVKSSIPNYLSGLPIPDTFGGWFKLGCKCGFSFLSLPDFHKISMESAKQGSHVLVKLNQRT